MLTVCFRVRELEVAACGAGSRVQGSGLKQFFRDGVQTRFQS